MGCREKHPKDQLLRVVRSPEGVRADPTGMAAGRGAYVHRNRGCVLLATRKGTLARALRVNLSPQDLATLQVEMEREID